MDAIWESLLMLEGQVVEESQGTETEIIEGKFLIGFHFLKVLVLVCILYCRFHKNAQVKNPLLSGRVIFLGKQHHNLHNLV